jgi:hypothetical protein
MSQTLIADTVTVPNGSDGTVYTAPAGFNVIIGSIIASNTSGGGLDLTIKVTRRGVTYTLLNADTIGASGVTSYNKGTTKCLTPLGLVAGDVLLAQGSGAGLVITYTGLIQSI